MKPDEWYEGVNFMFGTTADDFLDDWLVGLSIEVTPRFDIIAGGINGKTKCLKPGYSLGGPYGDDATLPQYDKRDWDWFVGVTMDTELFQKIFK